MFNEYVNLKDVKEHLDNEIKEISKRWASFTINKRALEKAHVDTTVFSKEIMKNYEKIKKAISGKNQQEFPQILSKFTEEEKRDFDRVDQNEKQIAALRNSEKGIRELEEFLEVATGFKEEINEQLKK